MPGPGPTSGIWLDVLKLLRVFVWGTVGRHSQEGTPARGACAHTCAHTCLHVRASYTPGPGSSSLLPLPVPCITAAACLGCRAAVSGPSDPPTLGCSSPGLALCLLSTCCPPHPATSSPVWGQGGLSASCGGRTKEALRLGSPQHTPLPVLAAADGETCHPGQVRDGFSSGFRAGPGTGVQSPGADNLSEHHETQVGPRVGLVTDSQHSGQARAAGAAGTVSPALFPADHTRPWAEMLPQPPRVPRKDSRVRRTSRLLQVRVVQTTHTPGARPRTWGRQRSPAFSDTLALLLPDRPSRCFPFPFLGFVPLPLASTLGGSGSPQVSFTAGDTPSPLKVSAHTRPLPGSLSLL